MNWAHCLLAKIGSAFGRWMAALSIASIGILVGRIYPLPFSICQGALVVVYLMIGAEIKRNDLVDRFCELPKSVRDCEVCDLAVVSPQLRKMW